MQGFLSLGHSDIVKWLFGFLIKHQADFTFVYNFYEYHNKKTLMGIIYRKHENSNSIASILISQINYYHD